MKRLLATLAACSVATLAQAGPAYTAQPLKARDAAPAGQKLFQEMPAALTGATVPNVYSDPRMWGDRFRELTLGAVETGVAVADFNGDGMLDIFVVSRNGPCALYQQVAPFKFVNVAAKAGVDLAGTHSNVTSATVVDINQDGRPDLYLCRFDAPNLLFINNGDGTFTEKAHEYGLDVTDASVEATFADYDGDGYLDCFLLTNVLDFSKSPTGRRNYLFHNNHNGTFTDVSKKAGIWGNTQGHTAIWFDANQDGWPDLYVANDFETPDRFYLNNGDGTFTDAVDERLPHVTYFSMGADSGDLNNDGLIDFMVTDMRDRTHAQFMTGLEEMGRGLWEMERVPELIPQYMWNAVYLNTGTDRYEEVAHLVGADATGWTWAARMADLDCSGRQDLFFTNGMIRSFTDPDLVDKQNVAPNLRARALVWKNAPQRREHTVAYRNLGGLKFEDVSALWGLDHEGVAFGCALADLDGDGDLDIIYNNYDGPPTIIRNNTTGGHRAIFRLAGRAPNRDAIGAEIKIETASGVQVRQIYTERGVVASEPAVAHFGLGADTAIAKATIRWPNGQVQVLEDLPADQFLTVAQPELAPGQMARRAPAHFNRALAPDALFAESAAARGLAFNDSPQMPDEFSAQRLLPRRLGLNGPGLAVADVNGDGTADVFVSGTGGQGGTLYLGGADGRYTKAPSQPWSGLSECDAVSAVFFDARGTGHPDLFLASGGVRHESGDSALKSHLYFNDGQGNFQEAPAGTLPGAAADAAGVAAAADWDGSGRPGLFVGGRLVPGHWPATPRSFLYRNTGGRFEEVTDQVAPGLSHIGMVTAAVWADVDGDGRPDLLLATEWGPVQYFHNAGGRFENWTARAGLAGRTGWWSALAVADLNGDGRPDLIVGNVGLNTKYRASADRPTVLLAGDLDGSGRDELVEAQYEGDQLYPIRGRSKLSYVFPWVRTKFPSYAAYARATIAEIFPAEGLSRARRLEANELASGVYYQQADGTFKFQPLPLEAQVGPVNGLVVGDLDGDGLTDVYCVGNNYGPEPSTGRFDGSVGVLLKGDGHGGLKAVPAWKSGLVAAGDARGAVAIPTAGQKVPSVAVAQCNGPLLVFTPRAAASR